jgi:hypothetical protein
VHFVVVPPLTVATVVVVDPIVPVVLVFVAERDKRHFNHCLTLT